MVWLEIQARVEIEREAIDDLSDRLGETLCGIDHSDSDPCPHDWILASRIVDEPTEGWMADLLGECGAGLEGL